MKGDYGKMMKQFQQMQAEMAKVEKELEDERVEASAGGGAVKVVASGKQQLVELKIDPSAVDPEDVEMLEETIIAAVNEVMREAQELAAKKLGRLTGGMGLPGL
ncbi:MAG: YbaB/EbfC family nucleoid-associated protein [Actinobacteria bacterium]|nr:YbaB/EbfC family nucleoid-associated protein [Actinomycetota bacterium]